MHHTTILNASTHYEYPLAGLVQKYTHNVLCFIRFGFLRAKSTQSFDLDHFIGNCFVFKLRAINGKHADV